MDLVPIKPPGLPVVIVEFIYIYTLAATRATHGTKPGTLEFSVLFKVAPDKVMYGVHKMLAAHRLSDVLSRRTACRPRLPSETKLERGRDGLNRGL